MNNPIVLKEYELNVVDAGSFKVHYLVFIRDGKFFMDNFLELVKSYLSRQLNLDGFPGNSSDINFDFSAFKNGFFVKELFGFEGIRVITLIHLTGIRDLSPVILLCLILLNNFNLMPVKQF